MKILFRLDVGPEIGLGRWFRCHALADEFAKSGATPVFLVPDVNGIPADSPYEVGTFNPGGPDPIVALTDAARDADLLVVDSPNIGSLEIARIRSVVGSLKTVLLDDRAGRFILANAVINPNATAYLCRYDTSPDCRTILGSSFALVRSDIVAQSKHSPESDGKLRIVTALTAFDRGNATLPLLRLFDEIDLDFDVEILIAKESACLKSVETYAAKSPRRIGIEINPAGAPSILAGASIGICSSGTTASEFSCMGIPAAYLATDTLFEEIGRVLARAGVGVEIGYAHVTPEAVIKEKISFLLTHASARAALSTAARMMVDGKGSQRILAKLSKYGIISF